MYNMPSTGDMYTPEKSVKVGVEKVDVAVPEEPSVVIEYTDVGPSSTAINQFCPLWFGRYVRPSAPEPLFSTMPVLIVEPDEPKTVRFVEPSGMLNAWIWPVFSSITA